MLDKLIGMLTGRASESGQASLLAALAGMLGSSTTDLDLGTLLGQLQRSGLSDQVGSWLGSGGNAAVSGREVRKAVDRDVLAELSRRSGLSGRQTADGLAALLPSMVDQLSPGGDLLEGRDLDAAVGGLGDLGSLLSP